MLVGVQDREVSNLLFTSHYRRHSPDFVGRPPLNGRLVKSGEFHKFRLPRSVRLSPRTPHAATASRSWLSAANNLPGLNAGQMEVWLTA